MVRVCLEIDGAERGAVQWSHLLLFVLKLAVAGGGDSIRGDPSAEWVGSIAA